MNKVLAFIASVIALIVMFIVGKGAGSLLLDTLRSTDGVVTAMEVIHCRYIIPIIFAAFGAYVSYKLVKE